MTSQLNYLIIPHRHNELVCRAEQARLANEARAAASAPSPTLECRSAPRRAPAPGCPLSRARTACNSRAISRVPDMRHMTARDPQRILCTRG